MRKKPLVGYSPAVIRKVFAHAACPSQAAWAKALRLASLPVDTKVYGLNFCLASTLVNEFVLEGRRGRLSVVQLFNRTVQAPYPNLSFGGNAHSS